VKNVLAIYYTQSGQLGQIAERIALPFKEISDINFISHEIRTKPAFPFPWTKEAFFDVFPESFLQVPTELEPIPGEILNTKFDLVLLFYQVWYLTPSIPINSFLKSPEATKILAGAKVVTINGSRNMWVMAQEKVKKLLLANNAVLVGNIALVDRAPNLISVITIVEWMFSGIRKRYLGIFPLPGVSERDIFDATRFGKLILTALQEDKFENLQADLVSAGGVKISSYLVRVDKTANKIFEKWSRLISDRKNSRKRLLKVFNIYLLLAIWLVSPIVYILHVLTYPFNFNKIKRESLYYQGVKQIT